MTTTPPDHVLVPREAKLLPCPFCSGKADEPALYGESKTAMFINCSKCGASVYRGTADRFANCANVIIAWNTRAISATAAPSPPTSGGVNAGLLEALNYVADMTCIGANAEWHFKVGYDPQRILDAISTAESAQAATAGDGHDAGHPHLVDGEFQSDKYPTTPRGKVPLSVKDKSAQDLLWTYAQRRRVVDSEFGDDLEIALKNVGFVPPNTAGNGGVNDLRTHT